jgi:DNA helicase-2/ATP-dependent DNA helicase PcrA
VPSNADDGERWAPGAARSAPDDLLGGLNEPQRLAVAHRGGPLLVVAGAGSGKTRVLTRRIAHLIATGDASPWEVLAITFTNKAAAEMKARLVDLVGPVAESMWVSTFHSACVRMLRAHAPRLGYRSSFTIYDDTDTRRLIEQVEKELGIDTKRLPPRSVQAAISAAKAELVDAATVRDRVVGMFDRHIADIYAAYQQRLVEASAMDFDDLLMVTVDLLERCPDVLDGYRRRFRHVLVDEYQDTNRAQNALVVLLAGEHHQVCAVGDLDQAIYGWRGADIANIVDFEQAFPGTTVVALEQNYRSTRTILDAANAVIANNPTRRPKSLWTDGEQGELLRRYRADDEHDEASWLAAEIGRLRRAEGVGHGDVAVFFRTNAQSRVLEEALVRAEVPYTVIGGTRFYDRREVKDILAYLRVLANPADEVSARRIVNVPRRGVGDTSVDKLGRWARQHGRSFAEALDHAAEAGVSGAAVKGIERLRQVLAELRQLLDDGAGPGDLVDAVVDRTGYGAELAAEDTVDARTRKENLEELAGAAAAYPTLDDYLSSVALVSDADELDPSAGRVSLMTLHTAKGLEFPVVFLVGMEDGIFPHSRTLDDPAQLEEERRLCYVGITRARQRLYVSHAWSRTLFGTTSRAIPSRFLAELPDHLVHDIGGGSGTRRIEAWGDGRWRRTARGRSGAPWEDTDTWGDPDEVDGHFADADHGSGADDLWHDPDPWGDHGAANRHPSPPPRAAGGGRAAPVATGRRRTGGSGTEHWSGSGTGSDSGQAARSRSGATSASGRRSGARQPGRLPKMAQERFDRQHGR